MAKSATAWDHDTLAADLAGHLRGPERMTWQNMQLGSMHSPRPDVYALFKSYSKPNPVAYECKISRSDFRADVTAGKWRSYLAFAWSVVFAVPSTLKIDKDELPGVCGLIVRGENGWRIAKRPIIQVAPIDQDALMKLLIDGVAREGPRHRARHYDKGMAEYAKRFGSEAARYVADAASVKKTLEYAELQREQILEKARKSAEDIRRKAEEQSPELWAELLAVLGLPNGTDYWHVKNELRKLKNIHAGAAEVQALRSILASLERLVDNNKHLVEAHEAQKTTQT